MKTLTEILIPSLDHEVNEKIGICLSGGGALGFAHIGVLKALEDHRIFSSICFRCKHGQYHRGVVCSRL